METPSRVHSGSGGSRPGPKRNLNPTVGTSVVSQSHNVRRRASGHKARQQQQESGPRNGPAPRCARRPPTSNGMVARATMGGRAAAAARSHPFGGAAARQHPAPAPGEPGSARGPSWAAGGPRAPPSGRPRGPFAAARPVSALTFVTVALGRAGAKLLRLAGTIGGALGQQRERQERRPRAWRVRDAGALARPPPACWILATLHLQVLLLAPLGGAPWRPALAPGAGRPLGVCILAAHRGGCARPLVVVSRRRPKCVGAAC